MMRNNYKCTALELYAVARAGWSSFLKYLPQFKSYHGYYDAAYASIAQKQINAAELLPDAQAHYTNNEVLRTELVVAADACLSHWQSLKRYISGSFSDTAIKPRLEEAGTLRYEKARSYNWEQLRMMNTSACTFIAAHSSTLVLGNNMPLSFPSDYNADIKLYNLKMQAFIDSEEAAYNATEAKIAANNAVYAKLMNMFKDGQEIFRTEEDIRGEFSFDTVLSLISGPSTAGIRGTIRNTTTKLPIEKVTVRLLNTNKTTQSDADGKYEITPLTMGFYDVRFGAIDYEDFIMPQQEIISGTISTLNVLLRPIP